MSPINKAALFDLDGTLLDTLGDLTSALNRTLGKNGFRSDYTRADVNGFIGSGALVLVARASGLPPESEECGKLRLAFTEEYRSDLFTHTRPYPGIPELLRELKARGVSSAVVSNKDDSCAEAIIEHFFGGDIAFTRGVRAEPERKPAPFTALEALKALHTEPRNAVLIGDGITDAGTAKNAGVRFIPVGYGYTSPEKLRDLCGVRPVRDVKELSEAVFSALGVK
ncbi:MAG: HAD hydrolase-like protein [Clostridia bacterium]|nr:HAD hydrolase-like protein [Clostridia bacterium]